jgi:hypothetical protein
VLLLVAVWFWIPLIVGKSTSSPPAPSGAATAAAVPSTPATPTAPNADKKTLGWKQAIEAMRRDAKMRSVSPLADSRDPFRGDSLRARQAEAEAIAAAALAVTPAQEGIELGSTVIGPRKRAALIGGKTYREGDTIRGSKSKAKFKLVEIHAQHIVLEQGEKRYQVWLPRAEPVGFED